MNIGFKEWTLVCESMGRGEQSIILRKGGIAEGREGFCFKHDQFFLFPTLFHEQLSKTKLSPDTVLPAIERDIIAIDYFVRVEWTVLVTDPVMVANLAPFHIWKDEVIEDRFRYDASQGVNLAFVRVYKLQPRWSLPDEPEFGGCRSWLTLPEPPFEFIKNAVIDDATHAARQHSLRTVLGNEAEVWQALG